MVNKQSKIHVEHGFYTNKVVCEINENVVYVEDVYAWGTKKEIYPNTNAFVVLATPYHSLKIKIFFDWNI